MEGHSFLSRSGLATDAFAIEEGADRFMVMGEVGLGAVGLHAAVSAMPAEPIPINRLDKTLSGIFISLPPLKLAHSAATAWMFHVKPSRVGIKDYQIRRILKVERFEGHFCGNNGDRRDS